jgi:hypothetical protein
LALKLMQSLALKLKVEKLFEQHLLVVVVKELRLTLEGE